MEHPSEGSKDESEGYAYLLQLVFDDLAIDLPGLYGKVGLTALIPVPTVTLRAVVEALDASVLESCWTDELTLGWVYQYWNDPEREALDAKLNGGGKVEPHEIASKTQMFTERYMVDWLLQNSLGPMWLAMCRKHGWQAEVEADGTLDRLEERRIEWRAKRDAGEVSLTELMPLHNEAERRWAYYVPQPIPEDAVEHANESVRDLKILDPALGSGHFLVVAFGLLKALYREEARHRGEEGEPQWSEQAIVERILEHNLHGIDLDPRAVQIAAAALWLKARQTCAEAHPRQLNLVASNLRLSSLPADDPARRELREEVERETGIPAALTQGLVDALAGADHLGSLLKIDAAVDEALAEGEAQLSRPDWIQGDLFSDDWQDRRVSIDTEEAKATLLNRIEVFLDAHGHGNDLGLRLRGEQLAAGVRFVRLLQEGTYDLVVANPPYQGTSKMADSKYIEKQYPLGKADLYAAFLLRGLDLVRRGGVSAMLTMRNWMFIKQYAGLRQRLLEDFDLRVLGDFDKGAFEEMTTSQLISICLCVVRQAGPDVCKASALQPTAPGEKFWSRDRTELKRAAVLCQRNRHEFAPSALKVVPEWPLVYWWSDDELVQYVNSTKLGEVCDAKYGTITGDDQRFLRLWWEVTPGRVWVTNSVPRFTDLWWAPYVKGAAGLVWMEPLASVVNWRRNALELKVRNDFRFGTYSRLVQNESWNFRIAVAFTSLGSEFGARLHRFPSVIGAKGRSVFTEHLEEVLCVLNSTKARRIVESLNPSVDFNVGDIKRVPLVCGDGSEDIVAEVGAAFGEHERHRETSIEFIRPGPSPWRYVQQWAQQAVDCPKGEPIASYVEECDPEFPIVHLSFALGVALGRFGTGGKGILNPSRDDLSRALPAGICFLEGAFPKYDISCQAARGSSSESCRWVEDEQP